MVRPWPCRRPWLRPVCTAVYVPCIWPCTRPFTACTDRVHRRARAVYMVRPRPYTGTPTRSCTLYTAVFTARVHGRLRPCTDCVHGRARATYMVRSSPYHCRVRGPYTAVYPEHGRVYGPCARHCTYRVQDRSRRVRTVYTGVQGPCTWCVHGRVQGTPTRSCTLYPDVFMARVHGPWTAVYTVRTRLWTAVWAGNGGVHGW